MGTLNWDILELARRLRFERLFVSSEQQHLQVLNDKALDVSSRLAQLAWVTARQRDNLNCLIVARPGHSPTICCRRANLLEKTTFIDGFKILGFQTCSAYGELLSQLRTSPDLLASCLTIGDSILSQDAMTALVHALAAGLLGGALLPGDRLMTLRLLQNLIRLELVTSENPRRLLRPRASSFSRLYAEFHEGLFEAKLFLTAALHQPIMQLLTEDEEYLDIDPDKAISRFSEEERLRQFGPEDGVNYAQQVDRFARWRIMRLARLTERFVESLRAHMHCFPSSLSWLVRQLAGMLTEAQNIPSKEVAAICTDLVFTCFVCPAIVNPEPYGITDAPISSVARTNLMHVARTIQALAVSKHEGRANDPKVAELLTHFPEGCVSSLLDAIIENAFEGPLEEPSLDEGCPSLGMARHAALLTESELHNLVSFLQSVSSCGRLDINDRKRVKILLESIPHSPPNTSLQTNGSLSSHEVKRPHPIGKKKNSRAALNLGTDGYDDNFNNLSGLDDAEHLNGEKNDSILQYDVLVIPFSPESPDPIGVVPEHKILRLDVQDRDVEVEASAVLSANSVAGNASVAAPVAPQESLEKRTRFSLSHDDGSIGNTSDNLEAVSEAASNHSVASSLELEENEDQNDNLSDMVSANVSGRGTPNISGRDTPSSQMTEGDDDAAAGGAVSAGSGLNVSSAGSGSGAPGSAGSGGVFLFRGGSGILVASGGPRTPALDLPPPRPVPVIKPQIRNDIDDKFGKFEIKKLLEGDETVSLVSDTWSTDVLASDSETLDAASTTSSAPPTAPPVQSAPLPVLLDVSETASEAWSTDVLLSDTERMTEVDTDDTASVARSDDTAEEPSPAPASTPGLSLLSGFRPIREDAPASPVLSRGLPAAPASPTRANAENPLFSNVTGRGGGPAESRRRTVEYVGRHQRSPAMGPGGDAGDLRLIHVIDKPNNGLLSLNLNGCSDTLNNSSSLVVNRENSVTVEGDTVDSVPPPPPNDILVDDQAIDNGNPTGPSISNGAIPRVVRLSSASLASTSSSSGGSASGAPPLVNGLPPPPPPPLIHSSKHGAIPKSISFDKTAERGDKDLLDEEHKQRRGFFRFKLPFKTKPRGSKSLRGAEDLQSRCEEYVSESGLPILRRGLSMDSRNNNVQDTTEDILAKYRNKTSPNERGPEDPVLAKPPVTVSQDERLSIDPNCVESSYAFADAKKKLRLVLSTADLEHALADSSEKSGVHENELVSFLQMQLAEAINLGERPLVAHLHETLRCIRLFDDAGCKKLFNSLKEDLDRRAPYIAYLVRCRQGLLSTLAHLERLSERVKCDSHVCSRFLVAFCVSLFLEKRETRLFEFITSFQQLGLPDEKSVLLDAFLSELHQDMDHDITWQGANEHQLEQARQAVERAIFSRVYKNALYPNGDGDVSRDEVLHLHMHKLSNVITLNHKDLRIPKMFHYECPWPSAQAEIALIAAYKTPGDKVQCVNRCATTIMNLLALACEQGTPSADDFVPVFVYVLIKANPPSLLSTIQYVNSFYGRRISGEEQYWWVQFCSAIEFIKTMDYPD